MISVIIPVFKVEKYLSRCIESILNQTYTSIEVILVDDGSPDECGEICDMYAKKDKRVKVIHKENGGQGSARNAGLNVATGDYISFIDSDDWIDKDMYEELLLVAKKTDADIVEAGYRVFRPWKVENKMLNGINSTEIREYTNIEALKELFFGPQMLDGISVMVWDKLYKSSLFNDNLRFSEGYIAEDLEFTPRALYKANKVVKYEKDFYTYNIHLGKDSSSGLQKSLWKLKSGIVMRKSLMKFFQEHNVEKVSNYTMSMYYGSLINGYYECWSERKKAEAYKEEALKLKQEIMHERNTIMEYCPGWKTKLFYFSPLLYCVLVRFLRTLREVKYKLRVLLTGKN